MRNRTYTYEDLAGKQFGRWTVSHRLEGDTGGRVFWVSVCQCGKVGKPSSYQLKSGKSVSCGCYAREQNLLSVITHGETHTKLYAVWKAMKSRCFSESNQSFKHYGARGITVDARWFSFEPFLEWANKTGYAEGLSIERVNNDGNYCPENCIWATKKVQATNRRNVAVDSSGEPWFQKAEKNGIPRKVFHQRRHDGWPVEKSATEPYKPRKRTP